MDSCLVVNSQASFGSPSAALDNPEGASCFISTETQTEGKGSIFDRLESHFGITEEDGWVREVYSHGQNRCTVCAQKFFEGDDGTDFEDSFEFGQTAEKATNTAERIFQRSCGHLVHESCLEDQIREGGACEGKTSYVCEGSVSARCFSLLRAIRANCREKVQQLLTHPETTDLDKEEALNEAGKYGSKEIMALVLKHVGTYGSDDGAVLILAAEYARFEIVQDLLAKGNCIPEDLSQALETEPEDYPFFQQDLDRAIRLAISHAHFDNLGDRLKVCEALLGTGKISADVRKCIEEEMQKTRRFLSEIKGM